MPDAVGSKPDVHDMVVVHRGFRRSCADLPDLVRGLRPGDTARAALVVDAVRFMLRGLEAHHVSEDELLWPRLAARTAGQAETIARMAEQHHRLEKRVTQVTDAPDELAADPRQPLCEQMAAQLPRSSERCSPRRPCPLVSCGACPAAARTPVGRPACTGREPRRLDARRNGGHADRDGF
ncbi:hemerythrin domain-containing protein [Streptomyces sp. NPDC058457]|uniref:hemerythrin domain-containing protein n=1 Tax=Streptomyces sp. NPDC058457 TaxID=3346507 RepID=UPI00365FAAE7